MYIHGRVAGGWEVARDETERVHLYRRDLSGKSIAFIAVVGSAALIIGIMLIFCWHKNNTKAKSRRQETQHRDQGVFDRAFGYLRPRTDRYQQASGDDGVNHGGRGHQLNAGSGGRNDRATPTGTTAIGRNTSVRSVMTLPAYRPKADHNEQVLGREGERDGIDVIVDLPTAEEEEALREEEMETMYQIRVTRRRELQEREERQQERREARERNDRRALEEIRERARAAGNNGAVTQLRENVNRIKETRQRSVSSVSYADVGLARHDGTRVRANSGESERVGLLSDAASIAPSTRSGARTPSYHQRGRSASSAISVDSDFTSLGQTRSREGSESRTPRLSDGRDRAGSSPELVEADLGDEAMPPPEYEDVSLEDTRSTTPMHEPPPDYPGPYRSASQRTVRESRVGQQGDENVHGEEDEGARSSHGVGGIPQLPMLRISPLPEIVIEPSSARPRD